MSRANIFHLTDHLGNVRAVIRPGSNNEAVVVQSNDYYPFGMVHSTAPATNLYLYNGKEAQKEMTGRWYDYGARFYDAQIARFHTLDPLTDTYPFQSPFVYAANNPILFIDYNGEGPWDVVKGVATTIGGAAMVITGGALCLTPTGVGQAAGITLISLGVPATGLGIAQIVDGAVNDGANDIPSGVFSTIGEGVDQALESQTGAKSDLFRNIGEFGDIGTSLVGGAPKTAIEAAATGVSVISAIERASETNSTENTNSQNNQPTQNKNPVPSASGNSGSIRNQIIDDKYTKNRY